ncbi:SCP2 sterol-binding domain-containing protein [Azomonas macrocytogenes]|uniref:Putative sterol carrier protein n=1 Tax=Azomonas macrocytogenes TaxID=69962 RepID=A0A839T397_AZOMA|nr:SCP2 sterol-binding domain-containing protein [Azomonas macrocytogenes]MBB3104001.1 putative sterol carrier protein [Azomonas macrocytogenes]
MSNVGETLKIMQSRFDPSAAAGLDLVFQFNITDAENYHVIIKNGSCDLQPGEHAEADVTLIMDKKTVKEIMSGETSGMQAFMSGRLRTEGNMMLAMKLSELFPS